MDLPGEALALLRGALALVRLDQLQLGGPQVRSQPGPFVPQCQGPGRHHRDQDADREHREGGDGVGEQDVEAPAFPQGAADRDRRRAETRGDDRRLEAVREDDELREHHGVEDPEAVADVRETAQRCHEDAQIAVRAKQRVLGAAAHERVAEGQDAHQYRYPDLRRRRSVAHDGDQGDEGDERPGQPLPPVECPDP